MKGPVWHVTIACGRWIRLVWFSFPALDHRSGLKNCCKMTGRTHLKRWRPVPLNQCENASTDIYGKAPPGNPLPIEYINTAATSLYKICDLAHEFGIERPSIYRAFAAIQKSQISALF